MKQAADSNKCIFDTGIHDFEQKVIEASCETPVLVDLWAEWCSPCLVIAPVLKQFVAESEAGILLAKVEVDAGDGENMKLAGRYHVRGFPTVILFVDGEEKGRFSGAKPLSFIRQFVNQHLGF